MNVKTTLVQMLVSAMLLAVFAVGGTALVSFTETATRDEIRENERRALLDSIHDVFPRERHDNDLFESTHEVRAPDMFGTPGPVTVYRATRDGEPVGAVFPVIAPDGYNGSIRLLMGLETDGTVTGVRVLSHKETPGLGDGIEIEKSNWIKSFNGKSLGQPPKAEWAVEADGGEFDQFTGATITPRAVVSAVRRALVNYPARRDELYAGLAPIDSETTGGDASK